MKLSNNVIKLLLIIVGLLSLADCSSEDNKDDSSQSEEQFVAVHKKTQTLDPTLPRLEEIVRKFIPNDKEFVRILNATREIVKGVKFTISFEMKNQTSDDEIYCEIVVLEKPWLVRNNQKFSEMTANNCSLPITKDRFHYVVNNLFTNRETEPTNVEDQIITSKPKETTEENFTPSTTTQVEVDETTTEMMEEQPDNDRQLSGNSMSFLDNFFNMNNFLPTLTATTTMKSTEDSEIEENDVKPVESSQVAAEPRSDNEDKIEMSNSSNAGNDVPDQLKLLEVEIKKAFSELFQTNPEFQSKIIELIHRRDDSEVAQNTEYIVNILTKYLKAKFENLENSEDSVRPKRALGYNKKKLTAGKIDFIDCDSDDDQSMTLNILSETVDGRQKVSFVNVQVDRNCDENSSECVKKIDRISAKICLFKINDGGDRQKRQLLGAPESINESNEEVQLFLREAIAEINKGEEPDYEVKRVFDATRQVVAGILVKFKANLAVNSEEVECSFEVWEQAWIADGREVTVNCNNAKKYKFNQIPLNQRDKNKTRQKRDTLVGGPTETDVNDPEALNLLNTHLKRLDTGSDGHLSVVSLEKITKKVVSGYSYEITGSFKAASDDAKKCTVTIWNRPWIQTDDGTQISATCDDGVRFKQRSKRSLRPLPDHHRKAHDQDFHSFEATELKSDVIFKHFQQKYNRKYANELEHNTRLRIFKKNLHKIDMLNKHEQGTGKYGITEFADMTEKEYLHKTGLVIKESHQNELRNPMAEIPDIELPDEFDWVEKGVVTPVKNQGQCGSCWSFSVTGNIEGLHAVKTGKLESYSEQELLDCDTTDQACNGGYMDDAFKAIEKIGGLELEDEYPYKAKKNKKCMFNPDKVHVTVKGAVDMPKGDEVAMQKYLVANGPISIGINAAAMQFYRGGVSHPWKILCRKSDLDHGVLLVGYGTKSYPLFNKTLPYWKIKNSWGPKWGEQGYYRIYRGDNSCGVAEMASSAILD